MEEYVRIICSALGISIDSDLEMDAFVSGYERGLSNDINRVEKITVLKLLAEDIAVLRKLETRDDNSNATTETETTN